MGAAFAAKAIDHPAKRTANEDLVCANCRSDVAFNVGGSLKLDGHINLLSTGGRDIVGDTKAMAYIGLQVLTK
jgi:hypothetical protein